MASDRPVIPDRGLESRIRAPTESPERETPREGGPRLDAENLRAASAAAAGGQQSLSGGRLTSVNPPDRARVGASPRKPGASGRTANPLLAAAPRPVPAGSGAVGAAGEQSGRGKQGGRPGQVYNVVTQQWRYAEEPDSDGDMP
jgi:hypothetical protein